MGGRGASSASAKGVAIASPNAEKHRKFLAGELDSRYSKSDVFYNEKLFAGMNYWREKYSKSRDYMHADRISADGNKIAVTVGGNHIFETPYGLGLQLDSDHVVYLKTWQVKAQNKPYMGQVGTNVVLDRAYFNVKKSKHSNNEFSPNEKALSFDYWKSIAKEQQDAGNYVSI